MRLGQVSFRSLDSDRSDATVSAVAATDEITRESREP